MQIYIFWVCIFISVMFVAVFIVSIMDDKKDKEIASLEQEVATVKRDRELFYDQNIELRKTVKKLEEQRYEDFMYVLNSGHCQDHHKVDKLIKVHNKIVDLAKDIEGIKNVN